MEINKELKEIVDLTSKLIQYPTVNPPATNMQDAATFMYEMLSRHGIDAKLKEYAKGWPVVYAEAGNKRSKKSLLLTGHFDVVPPGDEKSWKYGPYEGKLEGNKIYGRGASDMKAGIAIMLYLMKELAEKVDYKLIFAAVSDEETGGKNCSKHLAEEIMPDFVLIGEPSGPNSLIIGEKGLMQVKLICKGRPAHGSLPSFGINAIEKLIEDLLSLSKINDLKIEIPYDLKDVIKNTEEELLKEHGEKIKNFKDVERISFNIGIIKGGIKVNVVADYCEAEVDMRVPPGIKIEDAIDYAKKLVKNSEFNILQSSQPNYTSPNNVYIKKFVDSVKRIAGQANTLLIPGATDGRYFRSKNIPVLIYGPGKLNTPHTYNEYVEIEDIEKCYNVLKYYLMNVFNKLDEKN
jgi:acetylornithine deacetylase or succinyl-diaminopimelate desuccinylase